MSAKKLNEFEIIKKYFSPLAKAHEGSFGLEDDAAIFPKSNDKDYVVTTDMIVEGVHFFENSMPESIALKLMGTNLSDLAACGATPKYYLLNGTLSKGMDKNWLRDFSGRLGEIQSNYGLKLVGGDTVKSADKKFFSATLIGEVDKGKALLRSTAQDFDDVYVSGRIGEAWLGMQVITGQIENITYYDKNYFINKHFSSLPRVELGEKLLDIATSCTDVSDGLLRDLDNICKASSVSAQLNKELIPLADHTAYFEEQITAGDDYELLFTAKPEHADLIREISKDMSLDITRIGKITERSVGSKAVSIVDQQNNEIEINKTGYEHEVA